MSQTKYKVITKKAELDLDKDKKINKNDAVKFRTEFLNANPDLLNAIKNKFKSTKEKFIVKEVKDDTVTISGRGLVKSVDEIEVPIKALSWTAKKSKKQEDIMGEDEVDNVAKDADFSAMSTDEAVKAEKEINIKLKEKIPLSYAEMKMIIQRVIDKDPAQAMGDIQTYIRRGVDEGKFLDVFQETKFNLPEEVGKIIGYLSYKKGAKKSLSDKDLDYLIHVPQMPKGLVEFGFDNNADKMAAKIESILKDDPNAVINLHAKNKLESYLNNKKATEDQGKATQQAIADQQLADEQRDQAQVAGAEKSQQAEKDKEAASQASENTKIQNDIKILQSQDIPTQILGNDFQALIEKRDPEAYAKLAEVSDNLKQLYQNVLNTSEDYEFSERFKNILNIDPTRPVEGNEVETLVEMGVENADEILRNPEILFKKPEDDAEVNAQANAKERFLETYKQLKRDGHEFSDDFMKVFNGIIAPNRAQQEQQAADTANALDSEKSDAAMTSEGNALLDLMEQKIPSRNMERDLERIYNGNSDSLIGDLLSSNSAQEFMDAIKGSTGNNAETYTDQNSDNPEKVLPLSDKFKEFVIKLNDKMQNKQNTQGQV